MKLAGCSLLSIQKHFLCQKIKGNLVSHVVTPLSHINLNIQAILTHKVLAHSLRDSLQCAISQSTQKRLSITKRLECQIELLHI